MPTKHVDKLIEAYLDNRLRPKARHQVEAHIRECPACAHRLFEAERVAQQLGPVIHTALGRPVPRPSLHHDVKTALTAQQSPRSFRLFPANFFNAVGTVAVIAVLAIGLFVTLRSQLLPAAELTANITLINANGGGGIPTQTPVPTVTPPALLNITPTPHQPITSKGDTLPLPTATPTLKAQKIKADALSSAATGPSETGKKVERVLSGREEPEVASASKQRSGPPRPGGTIAYALFNSTPGREVYELHFINPDGSNHQLFPKDNVSEPALHPAGPEPRLAFRAWGGATSPRSLLTGHQPDQNYESVTHFWEDAQPDWSPVEDRIIFASQRESDRHWRLYTVWGDGSIEVNLRREGKSPTFAPDGYRFAFESCHKSGVQCGLWLADLENSEYGAKPFLLDSLAKSPDWSPVGEQIVYMANPDNNWDIYLTTSSGNTVRRLTHDSAIDGLPVWSPDGEWIAFVSSRDGEWGIWLLHVNSGALQHAITFEYGTFAPPEDLMPYSENDPRQWWDEQLSWGN